MRKAVISLLFISIFCFSSAQTRTFIGFKAGGGASTAFMQHSIFPVFFDVSWLPGANAGFTVTHFSEKFETRFNTAIQLGINYSQKGWIQQFPDLEIPNHKTRINYLEVPLEAVMYLGNKNKYYISAGFYLEYAISDNVDPTPEEAVIDTEYSSLYRVGQSHFYRYDIDKDFRLNYGPRGGAGVFRETGIGVFRLEFFFTFSIRSTFDYEPIESAVPDLSLNYGAGVNLGYMFSLGKLQLTE